MTFPKIAAGLYQAWTRSSRAFYRRLSQLRGSASAGAFAGVSLVLLSLFLASGCGLSGGSIPGGPATSGGSPVSRSFQAVGRVQSATAPYSPVTAATATIRNSDGSIAAGPAMVSGSGDFSFTGLPSGSALSLVISPQDPSLQTVSIPFASADNTAVQFVVALPRQGSTPPTSIHLAADTVSPSVQQTAQIQAVLTGGTPGVAPSWLAFGGVGYLSAVGPVAQFVMQSPGTASIFAVSGRTSAAISLTIPSGAGGTTGVTTGTVAPPPPPALLGGAGTGTIVSTPLSAQ